MMTSVNFIPFTHKYVLAIVATITYMLQILDFQPALQSTHRQSLVKTSPALSGHTDGYVVSLTPYCVLVTTDNMRGSGGVVMIWVDIGHGYFPVTEPKHYEGTLYENSDVLLDQCFRATMGIQVTSDNINGWIGSVLFSTDQKESYTLH